MRSSPISEDKIYTRSMWWFLYYFSYPYKKALVGFFVPFILLSLKVIPTHFILEKAIQYKYKEAAWESYFSLLLIFVIYQLILRISFHFSYYLRGKIELAMQKDILQALFLHISAYRYEDFQSISPSILQNRLHNIFAHIATLRIVIVHGCFPKILTFIACIAMLYRKASFSLALGLLLVDMLFIYMMASWQLSSKMTKSIQNTQQERQHIWSLLKEGAEHMPTLQAWHNEKQAIGYFRDVLQKRFIITYKNYFYQQAVLYWKGMLLYSLGLIGLISMIYYQAIQLPNSKLAANFVVPALYVIGQNFSLLWPAAEQWASFVLLQKRFENDLTCLRYPTVHYQQVLSQQQPTIKKNNLIPPIHFKSVTLHNPDYTTPLFDCINFTIAPQEKVGIVGASGSGKSRLIGLLMQHILPTSGEIVWGDRPIVTYAPAVWQQKIAWIPQQPLLFNRSWWDNMTYGSPQATLQEVNQVVERVGLKQRIATLEKGYQTLVGRQGNQLSGGERQRILWIRALLRKGVELMLLDEPTSSVDTTTEAALKELLEVQWKTFPKTVIIITHRLDMVEKMDRVIVLSEGKVIATGHPKKLISQSSYYRQLGEAGKHSSFPYS